MKKLILSATLTAYRNGTYRNISPALPAVLNADGTIKSPAIEQIITEGVIEGGVIPAIGTQKSVKLTGKETYVPMQVAVSEVAATKTTALIPAIPADAPAPLSALELQIKALVQPIKDAFQAHEAAHTSAGLESEVDRLNTEFTTMVGADDFDLSNPAFATLKTARKNAKDALANFVPVENPHAETLSRILSIVKGGNVKVKTSTSRTANGEQSAWAKLPKETKDAVKSYARSLGKTNTTEVLNAVLAKYPELKDAIASAENKKLIWVMLNK